MSLHAMIDLETLDTRPSCQILTLGAVKFNPFTNDEPYSDLYMKPDMKQQKEKGRTTCDSTIEWWSKQETCIREEAFSIKERLKVETMLDRLTEWLGDVDTLWGHGYGFDISILEDLYRNWDRNIPWNFWQVKDSRTLFSCCKKDPRKSIQNNLHNALSDAYFQAKSVQIAYRELGVKR
tara:strand:+ start:112 stop:648 length:537 start_codon:yes stop_codon:yes gene_type:complete